MNNPIDDSMIPCYFTLEELRMIKWYIETFDHFVQLDGEEFNKMKRIQDNINGKIEHEGV